jgi:hypothetical protein
VKICSEIPTHYNSAVATTTTEISVAIILAKKQKEDPQEEIPEIDFRPGIHLLMYNCNDHHTH